MRRGVILLMLLASCRQLLGFETPAVAPGDGSPDTVDAPIGCGGADDCPSAFPICLDQICVECTAEDPTLCTGSSPVCGDDHLCRGCTQHTECASEVCLADGACADPMMVAYVDPAGSGTACTQSAPCDTMQLAVATPQPIIKLTGTVMSQNTVSIQRAVVVHADPGAVLTRVATNGPVMDINQSAQVEIFDLTISGGLGGTGAGIRHQGGVVVLERVRLRDNGGFGIEARIGGALRMHRCIVSGNIGGGVDIDSTVFEITNSLVVRNGAAGSNSGGLRLKPAGAPVIELVTIADNVSGSANESGIRCDGAVAVASSIVVGNTPDAACTFTHTLFDAGPPPGTGNQVGDPVFLSTIDPLAPDFYRLGAASAAIDRAVSTIAVDLDGDARPQGLAPDMGADERSP